MIINKCIQDKKGNPTWKEIEVEDESITQNWDRPEKNVRVCFPIEVYKNNLHKLLAHNIGLENHPFLAALVVAVQNGTFIRVDADGNVYYYCEYVEEVDEAIIINYGGYVEKKLI